jgi:outer membrane protein assembly factor BamB
VLVPALAGACDMVALPVVHGRASARGVTVTFGAADDAAHPTAWQGRVTISTGSVPACVAGGEVSIVEAPILLGHGILYVPTYSGSNNRVYAVDTQSCRVLWRSAYFNGTTSFRGDRLKMGGKSVRLDDDCRPMRGVTMAR